MLQEYDPLELLTVRQAVELTKIGRTTLMRWIRGGELRAIKFGYHTVRIPRGELERFIAEAEYRADEED